MNMNAKLCLGTYNSNTTDKTAIALRKYTINTITPNINEAYQWNLEMVPTTGQGDLGYFWLFWKKNPNMLMDVNGWSLSAGASIINILGGKGTNEQWFLEYAGNNSWYIRSRHSGLYHLHWYAHRPEEEGKRAELWFWSRHPLDLYPSTCHELRDDGSRGARGL